MALETHYIQQFSSNVDILLQQQGSRLKDAVMTGTHKGSQASPVDQIGAVFAKKIVGRFQPMDKTEAPLDRRWVTPSDYDVNQLVDKLEELRSMNDIKSKLVENAAYAMGRAMDDEILAAIFGTNKTGATGATNTSFDTTNNRIGVQVGGSATDVGLNIAKLIAVRQKMMKNELDLDREQIFMAISAQQHADLLGQTQAISMDYQTKPVMENGKISSILGINFIHSEKLPVMTADPTERRCPVWVKSGLYLGMWQDKKVDVSERKDIQALPWQLYMMQSYGATRLEEKRVYEVICQE